jgi:hypothetical protein
MSNIELQAKGHDGTHPETTNAAATLRDGEIGSWLRFPRAQAV